MNCLDSRAHPSVHIDCVKVFSCIVILLSGCCFEDLNWRFFILSLMFWHVVQFTQSGRLRVNMGNIYYKQQKYSIAIKMYRMALDQTPNAYKETRYRIMRNIGNAFMRLGQYQVLSPHPHSIFFLMSTSFPPVSGLFTFVMQNLSTSKLQYIVQRPCNTHAPVPNQSLKLLFESW